MVEHGGELYAASHRHAPPCATICAAIRHQENGWRKKYTAAKMAAHVGGAWWRMVAQSSPPGAPNCGLTMVQQTARTLRTKFESAVHFLFFNVN
jgi:hypothetical protein